MPSVAGFVVWTVAAGSKAGGQDGLEVGGLAFACHDRGHHVLESGGFQPTLEIAFQETEPAVLELLLHPALAMTHQVENDHLAARSQDPMGLGERVLWFGGVMQCLGQHDEVDLAVLQGECFDVALAEWEEEQIAAYPHRDELIRTVALAMRDFMDSEQVRRHKMSLTGQDDG